MKAERCKHAIYAECYYAESRYTEFHYAECRGTHTTRAMHCLYPQFDNLLSYSQTAV
jgi:hypothetical protein